MIRVILFIYSSDACIFSKEEQIAWSTLTSDLLRSHSAFGYFLLLRSLSSASPLHWPCSTYWDYTKIVPTPLSTHQVTWDLSLTLEIQHSEAVIIPYMTKFRVSSPFQPFSSACPHASQMWYKNRMRHSRYDLMKQTNFP